MVIVNSLPNGLSTPFPGEDKLKEKLNKCPWTVDFFLQMAVSPWTVSKDHPALKPSAEWNRPTAQGSVSFVPFIRIKDTTIAELTEVLKIFR
jgi:hypothetical protein